MKTQDTIKTPTPNAQRPTRKVGMLVRRHLRMLARGKASFDKANEALTLARNCGLAVNTPIELEVPGADGGKQKEQFELVNNFAGEVVYRPARCPKFELKKVAKYKRSPKAEVEGGAQ